VWRTAVFAVIGCAAEPAPVAPSPPDAAKVLADMVQTYAQAKSYVDRGAVVTVFSGASSHTDRKTFQTAFVRGDKFRFEYRGEFPPNTMVVWNDGTHTYTSWSIQPGTIEEEDLAHALGAAAGVSTGLSTTIPAFLMPELRHNWLALLANPQLDADETIDGHACWRVRAQSHRGDPYTLWIDRKSHLLRRYTTSHHFASGPHGAFDAATTTTYEPTANAPVSAALLAPPDLSATATRATPHPAWIGVWPDRDQARVSQLVRGGPADRAGLRIGDVIVSIDGQAIANGTDIVVHTRALAPGKPAKFVVRRAGVENTIDVTPEPRPEQLANTIVDKPAPAIASVKLDGHVVVLEFWATWCGPCEITAPQLEALHRKYPELRVIGVSDEAAVDVTKYVADHKLTYQIALDPDDTAARDYLVQALPTLVVIDKGGIVRIAEVGVPDFAELEQKIVQLMK
jgi:thiol-disulfide isomerase/thioredoxin